ncbi:hypothetical protein IW261DRAFT_329318 [Armillaria novae-zelandiae]|uniref:Uncharacterized protein n=1 Tax=Armillaria novae-zelandiae TaxID=153914 RepID=A0AA39P3S5_9AGAR|nr:hypothetical protein IW261DRAFT_329318 [Armillaria novae-zelandiae]
MAFISLVPLVLLLAMSTLSTQPRMPPKNHTQPYPASPTTSAFASVSQTSTRIFLEIRYYVRRGFFSLILHQQQIIRTRISIALDQATTQLSVLPVDWEITADDPEPEYIHDDYADHNWRMFLRDVRIAMAPAALSKCIEATPLKDLLSHSTYVNRVMRFSGHGVHTERPGDVRAVNRRFGKAVPVPKPFSENDSFLLWARSYLYSGWWAFFAELYEDLTSMGDTVREW